jgi:hypothetical protein
MSSNKRKKEYFDENIVMSCGLDEINTEGHAYVGGSQNYSEAPPTENIPP